MRTNNGLIQLISYGEQDKYLTKQPQITFFKTDFRKHTNFVFIQIFESSCKKCDKKLEKTTFPCQLCDNYYRELINILFIILENMPVELLKIIYTYHEYKCEYLENLHSTNNYHLCLQCTAHNTKI